MTQHIFSGESTSDKVQLDANFTELYGRTTGLNGAFGSIGLGSNPSSWSVLTAFEGSSGALAFNGSVSTYLVQNLYFNGSAWTYKSNGSATYVSLSGGSLQISNAVSGVAGASATLLPMMAIDPSGNGSPGFDNSQKWGAPSLRWSTLYAGTGTINTSDEREKTSVTPMTADEIAAAQDLASCIGTYQWLSAIQEKGEGDARRHVGMTVQHAISVMTSHGLDPMVYGFICYDSWIEQKDEAGNTTRAAGDRFSFRPDELGMFIARGVAAKLATMELRLAAAGIA